MHAPGEWKLYDKCGVHYVISKDQEMFMLVEKDYPLRKGLAIGMISYKLQEMELWVELKRHYEPDAEDQLWTHTQHIMHARVEWKLYDTCGVHQGEHNTDFHPMVDFLEASPLRYALTVKPTVYVSHIRQFWSTARIETTEEGTKILAIVDGIVRTVSESSLRRNLKLRDEEGISSLQRQHSELLAKFQAQEVEILKLKERVKVLEDREGIAATRSGDDAPIKGRKQQEREDKRMSEQIARDAEVARIHAEEELQSMIDGLDRNNETIAKYLQEYQQFAAELPLERRIKLISNLVKYQENYAKIYKFKCQQRKPWTKKKKMDYYMAVIRNNLGWKVKDFKGMTFEEVEAKFNSVYKQMEDFIPMGSKEEAKRYKRKGIRSDQENSKKLKSSEEVVKEAKSAAEIPKEKIKEMIGTDELLEDHQDLVKKYLSIRPASRNKEMELWVELKRLYEPDPEDELWVQTQNFMHAPVEWKLYDLCGVHQVTTKDKEIFMLVEKDYPLRKVLALVMICYKLQVENFSHIANDLVLKIYKIANSPRQQGD
nr:hypothetical protein [Tanacetum cinerariifolium]